MMQAPDMKVSVTRCVGSHCHQTGVATGAAMCASGMKWNEMECSGLHLWHTKMVGQQPTPGLQTWFGDHADERVNLWQTKMVGRKPTPAATSRSCSCPTVPRIGSESPCTHTRLSLHEHAGMMLI